MTMRAWGVIALVVTTTLALLAGMLTLDPLGVPDGSFGARHPSGSSPRRGMQAPMIIAPPKIDLEPSSHAPLLIEIGPPEWVPHGSTLQVQGLPASVTLSHGRRVSSKLWTVPIAALSKVRIDVAANATAGPSDVTLTLVGSDGGRIAEAHSVISIDALTIAHAKEAAHDASGVVSRPQGPAAPAKGAAQSAHPLEGEEIAASPAPAGKRAAPSSEKPATAMQHEPVVASELTKPSVVANAAAGLDEPNGGPTTSVKGNLPSAHSVAREEIAARREVISTSPAPAGKQAAPSPQGPVPAAPREPVVASEPMKPSVAASSEVDRLVKPDVEPATSARSDAPIAHPAEREVVVSQRGPAAPADKEPAPSPENAAGLAAAKAGPTPARTAPSVQSVPGEENAAQRGGRGVPAEADKEPAPSRKGPIAAVAGGPVVASPEPAKPKIATSEAAGLAGVKAESTKPGNNDAQRLHPILGEEIATQREIKSAFAAPVDADATRGKASRGDLQEGERYVARGEASLAAGNVAVAREFFLRAADAGAARGALLLASTYDPYELVGLHVVGVQPNIDLARRWYKRAEALGEKHASERITRLERR
jgi:hypothetical protein